MDISQAIFDGLLQMNWILGVDQYYILLENIIT
ncbi:hypothetical protein J2743_002124 [Methanobacterium petrolearium]|nr:hypothetical protein [Methanobacterium petrolearium]